MSIVIAMVAWPRSSWTNFGWTFFDRSSVAHVCLRSWKRMWGRPARFKHGPGYLQQGQAGRTDRPGHPNHSPNFAPVTHPTLETGVEAMLVAARAWLSS